MKRDDIEQVLLWGLAGARTEAIAAVLSDLAESVPRVKPEVWCRHEVYPAAVALRGALAAALDGREQLSVYETLRLDAQGLGLRLGFVANYLRHQYDEGREVDIDRMLAYEDELDAQAADGSR